MSSDNEYYVYVYIDPRDFREFYYGKGKGKRKESHLNDKNESQKTRLIEEIKKAGLEPIIRVIASNLSEKEAFLIEKTLIWKLGHNLTNEASGHFSEKFRPHKTLYKKLPGFDFKNNIYHFNTGEKPKGDGIAHLPWRECFKHGCITSGGSPYYKDIICDLEQNDILAAYISGCGYVGIGRVREKAKPIREVTFNGKSVLSLELDYPRMHCDIEDLNKCEYIAIIEWIAGVPEQEGKRKSKMFVPPATKASLFNQPESLKFLEKEFKVCFEKLLEASAIQ